MSRTGASNSGSKPPRWTRTRVAAAVAALAIDAGLTWALIEGLRAHWLRSADAPAMTVTEIETSPPSPPPPPPPPPTPVPKPRGAATPPAARAPRAEPSPKVALASPTHAASVAGAAVVGVAAGAGSGAGGSGMGSGAGGGGGGGGGGSGGGLAVPAQRIGGALSDRDYPRDAGRAGGTVEIGFTVRTDGRVDGCRVLGSSGSARLDGLTCALVTERFRYRPARDASGQPVASSLRTAFTWGTR